MKITKLVGNSDTIVGECMTIEKDYFRLNSAPDPRTIRPLSVLQLSLDNLIHKWNNFSIDYSYFCSQIKSIRQDLTIQQIKNGIILSTIVIDKI